MKKIQLIIATALSVVVLAACEKSDNVSVQEIEGTYVGTLTGFDTAKSETRVNTDEAAIAEIRKTGNELIEVHLYSDGMDTTFVLNYYEHNNSVLVCLNGHDFENMYGHMLGQGHPNGGMMGDMRKGETEWTHHLRDEHQEEDEHFGGFDMQNHTFGYQLNMMDGNTPYHLKFQGKKE
ncbi:hypothetical protein ACKGJN_01205 [Gillisia sp. Q332]|uniref:hypothetical protein n=1 Tax=Gillisia xinjiangensis TaxID=3384765 RepID=UPI00391A1D93